MKTLEPTPKPVYLNRRQFIQGLAAAGLIGTPLLGNAFSVTTLTPAGLKPKNALWEAFLKNVRSCLMAMKMKSPSFTKTWIYKSIFRPSHETKSIFIPIDSTL